MPDSNRTRRALEFACSVPIPRNSGEIISLVPFVVDVLDVLDNLDALVTAEPR